MTTISHDPFSRTTIERETVHHYGEYGNLCANCGTSGKYKKGVYRLFKYTSQDDGRTSAPRFDHRKFCSIGCWRAFHS